MHPIRKLDKNSLREFGLLIGTIIAVLFGVLLPMLRHHYRPVWPWIVAGILWSWAIVAPATLNPVYQIWMRIGLILGWIETRIVLGIVFYVLILPMGLMLRLFNQDSMTRRFEANLSTYRIPSKQRSRESMEKPF